MKTKIAYESRWLNVHIVDKTNWTFISRRKENTGYSKKPDAVHIVASAKTNKNKKGVILIKQFRQPIGDWEWAFPAGLVEDNETAQNGAARELIEETGYMLTRIISESPSLPSSAGMTDECGSLVFGEAEFIPGSTIGVGEEQIKAFVLTRDKLKAIVNGNKGPVSSRAWPILIQLIATGSFANLIAID